MNYDNLLKRIMASDVNIRHSIITDIEGAIKATGHREGIRNYLSQEETQASLKRAAYAWKQRKQLYPKIGKGVYEVAVFEKITRITFPVDEDHLIFVSMGFEQTRTNLDAGGQKHIIDNVLNILSRDPTRGVRV